MYSYTYPHPAVTADCLVFGLDEHELKILLIQRLNDPFKGAWALPGGFVMIDEDIHKAALRELKEETGAGSLRLEQLGAWGRPERDPRERVITVVYIAIMIPAEQRIQAASDARTALWFPAERPPALAFDHAEILEAGMNRLREKFSTQPPAFEILPERFTLPQVQRLYECVLHRELDTDVFKKKLLATGCVTPLNESEVTAARGRTEIYRVDRPRLRALLREGRDSFG